MLAQTLTDIGLSQSESKIYLSLVSLGPNPATNISRETGIHRANVYSSLHRLSKKGLVTTSKLDKHVLFAANNPDVLLSLLKEKEDSLRLLLPQLALQSSLNNPLDIEVISGLSAFTNALSEFNLEQELVFIGSENNLPIGLSAKLSLFFSQHNNITSKFSSSKVLIFMQGNISLFAFTDELKTLRIRSKDLVDCFCGLF